MTTRFMDDGELFTSNASGTEQGAEAVTPARLFSDLSHLHFPPYCCPYRTYYFSKREAPFVLRKKITYVLKDESDRSHLPANCNLAPKAEKGGKVRAWPCTRKVAGFS